MMHGREKSDSAIVAGKPTNKAVSTAAEPVERRAEAKGNASQQSTRRTQSRVSVSQALERIRQAVTKNALPSHTQGGSRMPELGPYGSVRGALSNERPYRDLRNVVTNYLFERLHRFAGVQPSGLQHRCLYTAPSRLQSSVAHGLLRPRGHSSSCGCCLAGGGWSTIFITAVLLACTIIGIPFAWAHGKVAGLAIAQLRRGGGRQKKRGRRTATAVAVEFLFSSE